MGKNILIVGSDFGIIEGFKKVLQYTKVTVWSAQDIEEGYSMLALHNISLIILDFNISNNTGLIRLMNFKKSNPDIPVIVLTAYKDEFNRNVALNMGANAYISKPFDIEDMLKTIRQLLRINKIKPLIN